MASTYEKYHVEQILKLVDAAKIRKRKFRVALDAVNGAGGRIALYLLRQLGCRVSAMGVAMNGRFPHPPEPTPANLRLFSDFVGRRKVDLGFVLDPDADRLVLATPSGEIVVEEYTLAIAVWHFLKNIQAGPVVINQSTSRVNEDIAKKFGCKIFRAPVGEINVVEEMIRRRAKIGGEGNGGIIDPRLHYGRDAIHGMALILELLTISGKTLPQIINQFPRYTILKDKMPITQKINPSAGGKKTAKITRTDGLRLEWPDRWLHIRPSNTEPIIRIIAEAPTEVEARSLIEWAKLH